MDFSFIFCLELFLEVGIGFRAFGNVWFLREGCVYFLGGVFCGFIIGFVFGFGGDRFVIWEGKYIVNLF